MPVYPGALRVPRDSPKISGSASECPFPQWSLQVRMLLRTSLMGPRNPRLHKMREQGAGELSFVRRARPGPNGVDWRALIVGDSPFRERRSATTWEQLGRLCVHRDRSGQGELKSCTPPGGAGGPQAAAMRLNDRPTDGQPHTRPVILGRIECPEDLVRLLRG